MIWEEDDYKATLQAQMEKNAREWVKNKIEESKGIIRAEVTYG